MTDPSEAFARQVAAPADPARWRDRLVEGAAAACRAFDPVVDDTPVWDPSGAAAGVPFWSRRLFASSGSTRRPPGSAEPRPEP